MALLQIQEILRELGNPAIAEHSSRFFKTGEGEYGEGDEFLGVRVPALRKQAKIFRDQPLDDTLHLLHSRFHEERLCALFIMVDRFNRGNAAQRQRIFEHYLANTRYVNGWDLVDSSAHQIVGKHLLDSDKRILHALARSESLWERRIAIIATFHFIRQQQYEDTLKISETLLHDSEDLIHKAAGWMLREVGNRDTGIEEGFLNLHYRTMPRTMLRYAIEKFPEEKRVLYLQGII